MAIEENAAVGSGIKCGACGHTSAEDAKFCAGCGQSLNEKCEECGKLVLLTQKFCGSCGTNLLEKLQKRIAQLNQDMATAVQCAKNHEYDEAIGLLARASQHDDYRLVEVASQAKKALGKVETLRNNTLASVQKIADQAKVAFDSGDQSEAAMLLKRIPENLRSEELKSLLSRSLNFLGQESTVSSELQKAIKEQDWLLSGALLQQAISLTPEAKSYRKLATQVAPKLYEMSKQYFQGCAYDRAMQSLDSVPECVRVAEHADNYSQYEQLLWYRQQLSSEPFATATLGRLAVRFSKDAAHDANAKQTVKKLSAAVKSKPVSPRSPWAKFGASCRSKFGGDVEMLAYPQSVKYEADSAVRKTPGRFNVAIGLALQGLGHGRVQKSFVETKSFFGLGKRKSKSAWGIDLGSYAIRAVLLETNEEGEIVVAQSYYKNYKEPTCRAGRKNSESELRAAIAEFKEAVEIGDAPVWLNLPANALVNRFVVLPPLPDKKAAAMLESETEQKIPLAAEDLCLVTWIAELSDDSTLGRPTIISAAKKSAVESRVELFADEDIKISGMQSDPIALVNFVDFEFGDMWAPNEPENEDESNEEEESNAEEEESNAEEELARQNTAMILFDAGASSTKMILVSGNAVWFWTVEAGGEDLTTALAGSAKVVAADADEKKTNPAALESPRLHFEPVLKKQEELRARLEQIFGEAGKFHDSFNVTSTWCFGGACLTHAWIRNTLLS